HEAAKVLAMIAQTPEQLMLYQARLKAQRDESGRILQVKQYEEQVKQYEEQAKLSEEQAKQYEEQAKQYEEQAKQYEEQAKLERERAKLEIEQAKQNAGQGMIEAQARGILIGQIGLLQTLLKQPVSTDRELAACDDALLRSMSDELQSRLTSGSL
ncbi:MAG: hypothetical protein ACKO2P_05690, partial [Planctomycetota bacterium]